MFTRSRCGLGEFLSSIVTAHRAGCMAYTTVTIGGSLAWQRLPVSWDATYLAFCCRHCMLGTEIRTQLVKAFCSSLCALFHFFSTCRIFSARNNNTISNDFNDPQEKKIHFFFKCRIELGCSHPFWEGLIGCSQFRSRLRHTFFFLSLSLGQVTLPCYSLVADPRKIKNTNPLIRPLLHSNGNGSRLS